MKCSGNFLILNFSLYVISCLVETKEQYSVFKGTLDLHEGHLLSGGYNISTPSVENIEDAETSAKRSSDVDTRNFHAVNIPVPFHRVHYRPIHVARPVAYSKKPDVLINHVHVHNGG